MQNNSIIRPIICLVICLTLSVAAQAKNAMISGKLSSHDAEEIVVQVCEKYLDNIGKAYKTLITDDGYFKVSVPLVEGRLLSIYYKGKKLEFFAAPGDNLFLNIDTALFPEAVVFSGQGANTAKAWVKFCELFNETDFAVTYKSAAKGIHIYTIENTIANKMLQSTATTVDNLLQVERDQKKLAIDGIEQELGKFGGDFKDFMNAEINYDWAYKHLTYGYLYGKPNEITARYYDMLKQTPIQSDRSLGSERYQAYVLAYTNYLYLQKGNDKNLFVGEYNFLEEVLTKRSLELFRAALLLQVIKSGEHNDANKLYSNYAEKYPKSAWISDITTVYQKFTAANTTVIEGQQQAANKTYDEKSDPQTAAKINRKYATLTGFIKDGLDPAVRLQIVNKNLNGAIVNYNAILKNGFFRIDSIDVEEPRLVVFEYTRNKMPLFLAPKDSLHIIVDVNTFYDMKFSGTSGLDNDCLFAFRQQFNEELNMFNTTTFKKGIHTYIVETSIDDRMRALHRPEFEKNIGAERAAKQAVLENFEVQKGRVTDAFRQYMTAEITYDWAYKSLVYGFAYGNMHQLTDDYFNFLAQIPVQNKEALASEKYQQFIMAYINYAYMKQNTATGSPFVGQYVFASNALSGKPLQFFRTVLLVQAIREGNLDAVADNFKEFIYTNDNPFYAQILTNLYQDTRKYSAGSEAPPFKLADNTGKNIALTDLKGKVIYLDFWATWCGSCIRKMALMQEAEKLIMQEDPNVVFVHVSLDKNVSAWQTALQNTNYPGLHLNSPDGPLGALAKEYNINALPEYYLIDKSGLFAEKPASHDTEELKTMLFDLSKKTH